MRKILAVLTVLTIMLTVAFCYAEDISSARYDGEIKFQDVEWGQSDVPVVDALVDKGLIDKWYFSGSGSKPCFVWPENIMDMQVKSNNQTLPDIIRENGWKGAWKLQYTPKKLIGGHDPDAIFLNFTGNVGKTSVSDNCSNLIAVSVNYTNKSTEIPLPAMFVDLLSKLADQYGKFDVYINSAMENDYFLHEMLPEFSFADFCNEVGSYAASLNYPEFDEYSIYAFAVVYGENNTGIVLRFNFYDDLELIYSKTDSYLIFQEIARILQEKSEKKDDAGL